jgi:3-isopropylmalate/(R)-2-methylmalate dehydratase large subunit
MRHTAIEKIVGRASSASPPSPGDFVVCDIDTTVLIDFQFRSFNQWSRPRRIADPSRVAVILDHAVPAPTIDDANAHAEARRFASEFNIDTFFDVGSHGICHQVIAEQGLARPGTMLVCADSHTCSGGAFNCAARGLGPLEVLQVLCTGQTWMVVPETVRIDLNGSLGSGVTAKDVFLTIAKNFPRATENRAIEFDGEGLAGVDIHERRVLATQGIELLAEYALFPCDEVTVAALATAGVTEVDPIWSDPDATFADRVSVDLTQVEPFVGLPGGVVDNAVPVSQVGEVAVQQCFIGSCANGQLDDLGAAAAVLSGHRVAIGTRLIVTPASQRVFLDALKAGYVETLVEAGAVVTNPGCGACPGYHLGVLGDGETCITASTRNFRGRMGSPDARIFLASPATVAASAVAGRIVDSRSLGSAR